MKFIIELYDEIRYEGLIEYILDKEMNYLSTKKIQYLTRNSSYRVVLLSYSIPCIYRDLLISFRHSNPKLFLNSMLKNNFDYYYSRISSGALYLYHESTRK